MCAVHSQPVKGRADVLLAPLASLAPRDVAFMVSSSALCHLSVPLAFLTSDGVFRPIKATDHIQVKQNSRTQVCENNTWWVNQKWQIKLICLIQMD